MPSIPKSNPLATPPEQVERIQALSREYSTWGCNILCECLALEGIKIGFPTIQNTHEENGMGTRIQRLLKLEEYSLSHDIELNPQ